MALPILPATIAGPHSVALLEQTLPTCDSLWGQGIEQEYMRAAGWHGYMDRNYGRYIRAVNQPSWRLHNPGYFETLIWTRCVPDIDYNKIQPYSSSSAAGHRQHIYAEYEPECWSDTSGAVYWSNETPTTCPRHACRGCRFPLHLTMSVYFSVFHWQSTWGHTGDAFAEALSHVEAGRVKAQIAAGRSPLPRITDPPVSLNAMKRLRKHVHSSHNRGPFHWVPFLEMFDWLFLQWNPKTYEMMEKLMRTALENKYAPFPSGDNLPFVGAFLVQQRRGVPRSIFLAIPLLPYLVRYVLPAMPTESKVAVYLGRAWEDAVIPRRWLRFLAEHPKVAHVFGENPQLAHPRITPMPIGMDPVFLQDPSGMSMVEIAQSVPLHEKIIDRAAGGWADRGPVRVQAREFMTSGKCTCCDWIIVNGEYGPYGTRQLEYWRRIVRYGFLVSPPAVYLGEGPRGPFVDTDSYKTIEALVLGTIPILWDGPNAWAWEGLPVVRVKSWDEITPSNLKKWWRQLSPMLQGDRPYLRSTYWWHKIERVINATSGTTTRPPVRKSTKL